MELIFYHTYKNKSGEFYFLQGICLRKLDTFSNEAFINANILAYPLENCLQSLWNSFNNLQDGKFTFWEWTESYLDPHMINNISKLTHPECIDLIPKLKYGCKEMAPALMEIPKEKFFPTNNLSNDSIIKMCFVS